MVENFGYNKIYQIINSISSMIPLHWVKELKFVCACVFVCGVCVRVCLFKSSAP